MTKVDLLIIGTGLAGYHVAKQWRAKMPEASLGLVTASQGHFYSKPQLSTALASGSSAENLLVFDANHMAKQLNAEIITEQRVDSIDVKAKQVVCANGTTIGYQKLVLALGAEPKQLVLTGNAVSKVLSINQWEDYHRFRKQLARYDKANILIVGAGLVSCELANDLLLSGHQVTMVAIDESLLPHVLPEVCSLRLQDALQTNGLECHLSREVISVDEQGNKLKISTTQGEVFEADIVISAIGLKPAASLAEQAGLAVKEGIEVNALFETSHPDVFAIGDCAEVNGIVRQYVAPIVHGAKALALTLSGNPTEVSYPLMPIVIKTSILPIIFFNLHHQSSCQWHQLVNNDTGLHFEGRDDQGQLSQVLLMGDCIKERQAVLKQCSELLESNRS